MSRVIRILFAVLLGWALALGPAAARQEVTKNGVVAVDELPREARETLVLIKKGGPFPYQKDGSTFGNFEKILPARDRAYYREYTVPTPGAKNRGARRIVAGRDGDFFYTDDHYNSFRRIKE